MGIGCLWKNVPPPLTSTENRNPKNGGPNSQNKGLYQLRQSTADPSVRQSPSCIPACTVTTPCSHLRLRAAGDTCSHSAFIYPCCFSPVVQDFEKGDHFILSLVLTVSRKKTKTKGFFSEAEKILSSP